jgi:glycosyltransferase involved in cell wall biosynthesis
MTPLSIIIATYQGVLKIPNALASLLNQNYTKFNVIIIIDGSTDNTHQKIIDFIAEFKPFYKIEIHSITNRGRCFARNKGASLSKAEYLLFMDDDMILENDCIDKHITFLNKKNKTITVGTQLNKLANKANEFERYKNHYSFKWHKQLIKQGNPFNHENPYLTAAHFCIKRIDFLGLNGFDEAYNISEDFELAKRAYENQFIIYYLPNAVAYHNESINLSYLVKQEYGYLISREKLYSISYVPKIGNHFFANSFIETLLLKFNVFKIFPNNFKFKLYSYIIYSKALIKIHEAKN